MRLGCLGVRWSMGKIPSFGSMCKGSLTDCEGNLTRAIRESNVESYRSRADICHIHLVPTLECHVGLSARLDEYAVVEPDQDHCVVAVVLHQLDGAVSTAGHPDVLGPQQQLGWPKTYLFRFCWADLPEHDSSWPGLTLRTPMESKPAFEDDLGV